jgi:hypothetical protein
MEGDGERQPLHEPTKPNVAEAMIQAGYNNWREALNQLLAEGGNS